MKNPEKEGKKTKKGERKKNRFIRGFCRAFSTFIDIDLY